MKMLVYGGRDYTDRKRLHDELDRIHVQTPITQVIEGGAPGADRLARNWARTHGIPVLEFPADWNNLTAEGAKVMKRPDGSFYNNAAGNQRNLLMLSKGQPDIAVEFPGARGTANMRRLVRAATKRWPLRHIIIERETK